MSNTRSAAALELWRPRLDGALVAIGNAPTALFHLLNMLEDPDCPRPAAIIGCPVGFVGAAESKDALWADQPVPCCIVKGRLGGSAITVAAINAIARSRGMTLGTIYGVGLGPGDPDLMSVRADRLLRKARHVAFFRKAGRSGQARRIIEGMLREDVIEFPMEYPVTTEIPLSDPRYNQILSTFYETCTAHLRELSESGEDVVVISEGDPFFYGSFMHLFTRLKDHAPVEVVPAAMGMSAAWAASGAPITWGDDILTVLMGTLSEDALVDAMSCTDALVVMKLGRNLDKVRRALKMSGLYDRAWLVEYASMPNQSVQLLSEFDARDGDKIAPYFSIILVHGQGRRP